MSKYQITVEVNEDKLRSAGEEEGYEASIESLIMAEMGWVDDSGIYVVEINELT